MRKLSVVLTISITILLLVLLSCERKAEIASPNDPPNTTLANIPVVNDTLFALVTLHWDGEDNDGFISGYQYRYITKHMVNGDSVVQEWVNTTQTSITIPFESSDLLNHQRFQVRAIDDKGDADPSPAEKEFYTVQTIFPQTEIISPKEEQQFFIIDQTTDWWQGVPLTYHATDQDGEVIEYAWKVDDGEWNWTTDTTLFIDPSYFETLDGSHKIYVTCRDNTNLVDPIGDVKTVNLIRPTFDQRILIIDETDESLFSGGLGVYKDADVDSFYARMFGTNESWDFKKQGMPPKSVLGRYKLVIWHADNPYSNAQNVHKLPANIEDIKDYLNVGGDFIMGGWRILKSFAQSESFPKTFDEGTFIHDYLHILTADESSSMPDFTGCTGFSGFTDIQIDPQKLKEFPYFSMLSQINIMPRRAGFTDVIYTYANDITGSTKWRGEPTGIRYYGTSFNTIVLGFPMFFIRESDAQIMANEMLKSLGY
ncbi:MAG: hypothetical protein P8184_01945 [Calditrichia bacterium]